MSKAKLEEFPFLIKVIKSWHARIKEARITQKKISIESGVSEVTISNTIRLKNKNPRLSTIQKIEDVLDSYNV